MKSWAGRLPRTGGSQMRSTVDNFPIPCYNGVWGEEMGRKTKTGTTKLAFRIIFLTLFILESILLCVESLLPGKISSVQSGAVGEYVDDVMTGLGSDTIRDVPPVSITALCGGKEGDAVLSLGASASLGVRYEPSDTSVNYRNAEWRSDDEEVVRIASGKLYAAGLGTATVTATLPEKNLSSSIRITVEEVIPTQLTLSFEGGETSVQIEEGEYAMLSVKTSPHVDVPILFSSSDEAVATVDAKGTVHAVSEGTATLTARYTSKTLQDGAPVTLTAEAYITVTPRSEFEILPQSIEIVSPASVAEHVVYAGVKDTFAATLLPADCSARAVSWRSSAPNVLTVDAKSGAFTALKKGKATVTAYGCGEIACSVDIEVRNRSLGATLGAEGAQRTSAEVYTLTVTAGREIPLAVSAGPEEYFVRYFSEDPEAVAVSDTGVLLPSRATKQVRVVVTVSDDPDFSEKDGALTETITLLLKIQKQKYSDGITGFATMIRKLFGHFGAFLLLGLLAAGTAISFDGGSWKRRLFFLILFLVIGFLIAGLTEILQLDIFTSGRGASFRDVGIDYFGFAPAFTAVYGAYLFVKFLLSRKKKKDPA